MENLQAPQVSPAAKVALLIDADNISGAHAGKLLEDAAAYGNVIVRRAYGVFINFPWKQETLLLHKIQPVTCPVYASGKNITDITLVIDAMDLAHRKDVDVVCIASNDSDFAPLVVKLREYGIAVYGFPVKKAAKPAAKKPAKKAVKPAAKRAAKKAAKPSAKKAAKPAAKKAAKKAAKPSAKKADKGLIKNLTAAYMHCKSNDGWANASAVSNRLIEVAGFSPKKYGHASFKKLIESMDGFEFGDNKIRIKDKPKKKK